MVATIRKVPNRPGVWYKIWTRECPLCGFVEENRERREGPKPESPNERYSHSTIAYHCGFM